jgi:hypothetical protein
LTLEGLTANRLIYADGDKGLQSISNLASWIAGTANQITVTDDSDGTITLSAPQNLHTAATPTFATALLTNLSNGYIPYHQSDALGLANSNITHNGSDVTITFGETGQFIIDADTTASDELQGAMYLKFKSDRNSCSGLYISANNIATVGSGAENDFRGQTIYASSSKVITGGDYVTGGLYVATRKYGASTTEDYLSTYGILIDNLNLGSAVDGESETYGLYSVVVCVSDVNSTAYAVYGYASGAGTNWAGYFDGNVNVTETLTTDGMTSTGDIELKAGQRLYFDGE